MSLIKCTMSNKEKLYLNADKVLDRFFKNKIKR